MIGHDEYFDVELAAPPSGDPLFALAQALPPGIEALAVHPITGKVDSLMSLVDHADFIARVPDFLRRSIEAPHVFAVSLREAVQTFLSHERAFVVQHGPHGDRPVEIRAGVRRLEVIEYGDDVYPALSLSLRIAGEGAVRPIDLTGFLLGEHRLDPRLLRIERLKLYGLHGEHEFAPFDALGDHGVMVGALERTRIGQAGSGRQHVQGNSHQRRSSRDQDRYSRRW